MPETHSLKIFTGIDVTAVNTNFEFIALCNNIVLVFRQKIVIQYVQILFMCKNKIS